MSGLELSPREHSMHMQLMETENKLNKWTSVLYLIVTALGKDYKLVIDNVSSFDVPVLENELDWTYDKEDDTLTLEIKEKEEPKLIIEV